MADVKAEGLTPAQQHRAQLAMADVNREPIPVWDEENPDPGASAPAEVSQESAPVDASAPAEVSQEPASDEGGLFGSHTDVSPEIGERTRYFPLEGKDKESTVGVVEEGGRMAGLDGLQDMWSMSRDLESTVASLARMQAEKGFTPDSNYNPADHLDELNYNVPEGQREELNTILAERAINHEHAQFLKGRFEEERFQQAELNKYGLPGMISQFSAAMFDEGAIALGITTGGVAAAAYKLNRLKAIVAAGTLSGAENAALEAVIKEGSVTRTNEDLMYAAAIGAVLGGGFGAIFSKGNPGTLAKKIADEQKDGSVERLKQVDEAIIGDKVRDEAGDSTPPPIEKMPESGRTVVEQHAEQLDAHIAAVTEVEVKQRETLSLKKKPKAATPEPEAAPAPTPARDFDAELKQVDEAIARQGIVKEDARLNPQRAVDSLDEIGDEVSFIKSVRDGTAGLTQKLSIKAEQDFGKAKRDLMEAFREADPDGYKDVVGNSRNPDLESFEEMLPAMEKAIRKAAKTYGDDATSKATALDELATLKDELLDARDAAKADEPTGGSVGAAGVNRAGEFGDVDLDNITPELSDYVNQHPESVFVRFGGKNQGKMPRIRYDLHATSQASPSKLHAVIGDHIGEDSVGKKGHAVSEVSASEIGITNNNINEVGFTRVYNIAEPEWMEEMGVPKYLRWKPELKEKFGREVSDHVEFGNSNSPAVHKAAAAFSKSINDTADRAARYDVEGFRDFDTSDEYIPRIHDQFAVQDLQQKYGREAVMDMVESGIRKAQPDIDPPVLKRIAKGYVDGIALRGAGVKGQYHDLGIDSIEYVQGVLKDVGVTDEDALAFVRAMTRETKEGKNANTTARAKKRLLMDVDVEKQYRNLETGEMEAVKLTDMFVRDARVLAQHYVRNVGGMAAVAERTHGTPMHMRSRGDLDRLLDTARRQHYDDGGRPDDNAFNSAETSIRMMFDRTVGTPLHDPSDKWTVRTRRLKNWNVSRLMGQVVFAQMSEQGTTMATVGTRAYMRQMPEFGNLLKRAADGKLDNETAAVIEDLTGLSTDRTNGRIDTRYDSGSDAVLNMYGTKSDLVMNDVNRAVLAPMHMALEFQQRSGAIVYTQRLTDAAMGLKQLEADDLNRLKGAGIGKRELAAINKQIKKHAVIPPGSKLHNPMLQNWDDPEAMDKFRYGLGRVIRRAVQENSIGTTSWLSNTRLGGLLLQFRGFMLVAFGKQTLHGAHHRDLKTFQNFTMASMFAALGWTSQTYFKSALRDDAEEYRKKMLTPENAMKAGFQRSAWATFMPAGIDLALRAVGQDPQFEYRSSGLANTAIDSAPFVDLSKRLAKTSVAVPKAIFNDDYQLAQRNMNDIRYSLPLANSWATTHLWNWTVGQFPESNKQ